MNTNLTVKELAAKYDISDFFFEVSKRERDAMVVFEGATRVGTDEMNARLGLPVMAIKLYEEGRKQAFRDMLARYGKKG